jgi:predicted RNase H-like HicB family nuclease
MDTSYFSIIERADDGSFTAWVPDLPGVTADGATEEEVLQRVFRNARECLRHLIVIGQPLPEARPLEELPQRHEREFRRLLLIIS